MLAMSRTAPNEVQGAPTSESNGCTQQSPRQGAHEIADWTKESNRDRT